MKAAGGEEGFTLVEVTIASAILAVLSIMTLSVMAAAQNGYSYSRTRTHLEDKTRFVLKEIVRELACTGMTCPDWSLSSSAVTYRRCTGYDFQAENKGWGPRRTIQLDGRRVDFSEIDDGGSEVFTRTLVDEVTSFSISQDLTNPDLLTVTLSLEGRDSQGNVNTVSRGAAVFLRN